ncbi:g12408 [Coccomyxa viridis]|uniref:G12408 protein n=1 Tax=Coccomyxa viridis TaxID=1274662 RepID=A0ABP1GED4_9CHLO
MLVSPNVTPPPLFQTSIPSYTAEHVEVAPSTANESISRDDTMSQLHFNKPVQRHVESSPFQEDAVPLTAMLNPGPGTWPGTAQTGAELQWKLSSIDSNDFAACNFAMLEPRASSGAENADAMRQELALLQEGPSDSNDTMADDSDEPLGQDLGLPLGGFDMQPDPEPTSNRGGSESDRDYCPGEDTDSGTGKRSRSAYVPKKVPKKLGRPVTFRGDPESSQLSDGERKRIKRRIANRESARRVRQKRQVGAMQQHNHRLLGHCKRLERQKDVVMAQVRAMQDKWQEAEATRAHLQNEVDTLRKTLEARPCSSTPCTMNLRFLEQATAPSRMAPIREDYLLQDFVPIAGEFMNVPGVPGMCAKASPQPFKSTFADMAFHRSNWMGPEPIVVDPTLQHARQHRQIPQGSRGSREWVHKSTAETSPRPSALVFDQVPRTCGRALGGFDLRTAKQATTPFWQL